MHKETKATSITPAVKREVMARDGGLCVVCGKPGEPVSHVVRRSQGGLGTVQNIVTHCWRCHQMYDLRTSQAVRMATLNYILQCYPGWTEESVKYSKWSN